MATACSAEYCKRCGIFAHDTVGCDAECKRCGGRHATKECFRKRSYVRRGSTRFPALQQRPGKQNQNRPAQRPGVVIEPTSIETQNPAPVAEEGARLLGQRGVTEKEGPSDAASSPALRDELPESSEEANDTIAEMDLTAGSDSDPSSAETSRFSWPESREVSGHESRSDSWLAANTQRSVWVFKILIFIIKNKVSSSRGWRRSLAGFGQPRKVLNLVYGLPEDIGGAKDIGALFTSGSSTPTSPSPRRPRRDESTDTDSSSGSSPPVTVRSHNPTLARQEITIYFPVPRRPRPYWPSICIASRVFYPRRGAISQQHRDIADKGFTLPVVDNHP
ncbi:hypothetical protein HPB52_023335 [Rhipicephalus sanguineus]|uniref:Uncharacterized protein n=1 Tax=Rhipicephalus sanguineus TaxID=34632 RepID=A0A9D4QB49_RHISA|nr:hypothetical protein HPB52_023335 [Rhipicephalus sanguineus]